MEQNKGQSGAAVRGEAVAENDRALKEYSLDEYQPGQWWLTELENHASHQVTSADTRRAAGIALDFAAKVFSARAADAPSEPSEKFGLLRIADNGKSVTVVSDERFWAGDYSIPDGMYRIVSDVAADALDSQPTDPYPLLRAAFTTAESGADGYFVKFRFPTLQAMQDAHRQWVDASSQPTDGGVRNG